MDVVIPSTEADMARLLLEVGQGHSVTLTADGKPVARVLPFDEAMEASRAAAREKLWARLRELPGTLDVRSWTREELYEREPWGRPASPE